MLQRILGSVLDSKGNFSKLMPSFHKKIIPLSRTWSTLELTFKRLLQKFSTTQGKPPENLSPNRKFQTPKRRLT